VSAISGSIESIIRGLKEDEFYTASGTSEEPDFFLPGRAKPWLEI
jgi:hypothetical protein